MYVTKTELFCIACQTPGVTKTEELKKLYIIISINLGRMAGGDC